MDLFTTSPKVRDFWERGKARVGCQPARTLEWFSLYMYSTVKVLHFRLAQLMGCGLTWTWTSQSFANGNWGWVC